ncbi:hypothetical protein ATK36_5743 [Amycolatopsis sulphurea]|uniref:Uncharacterized protein n=1 Tax=Amycolatopsis sulphurea TaxID=76022 RepID=A0A2A9FGL9_9PSEU|nr:hypothetical protein ATK36_5743 [Amycolatopsis sulphurea]
MLRCVRPPRGVHRTGFGSVKGPFTDSESVKDPFTDLHTDFADTLDSTAVKVPFTALVAKRSW